MISIGVFPFGQPVYNVIQTDRAPKSVFILGVYASAVHAQWIGVNQKTTITALAVASEPYNFWRGDNAESIIRQITIPQPLGTLVSAKEYNGPSGIALDDLILKPLGITRTDAWLCDLVPHSCMNPSQEEAIKRAYLPVAQKYALPIPTVPLVPKVLADEERRASISSEIHESGAGVLILLGDKPIQWFLSYFDNHWEKLADFGHDNQSYGRLHNMSVGGKVIKVLPLAHPRQIAELGLSSAIWTNAHNTWIKQTASKVAQSIKTD